MNKCGIYKITNKINGKFYIGSSSNIEKRWNDHLIRLRNKSHVNDYLQNAFDEHGEFNFHFEIIELTNPDEMLKKEQQYLYILKPFKNVGYNISWTGSGGDFKYHPDKERIYDDYKLNNTGKLNPFYGKKHSPETIEKMRIAASKRKRRKFNFVISESEIQFVKNASFTIKSVKGIVKLAYENEMVLGRIKVKKILQMLIS